jgi:hypothetical protein
MQGGGGARGRRPHSRGYGSWRAKAVLMACCQPATAVGRERGPENAGAAAALPPQALAQQRQNARSGPPAAGGIHAIERKLE